MSSLKSGSRRPDSQRGRAGGRRDAAVVEAVLTDALPEADALHLVGRLSGERRLQLGPLGAHFLVLGFDVILAVLAFVLDTRKKKANAL